jgi:hypothetical protein
MALRIIEIYGVSDKKRVIEQLLGKITILGIWQESLTNKRIVTRILLDSEQIEPVLEILEKKYSNIKEFQS